MSEKKTSLLYKIIKFFVKAFFIKITAEGAENLPKEPAIIVGNHCQMNGPLASEFYFPTKRYTWCAGQMMHLKDVPSYAFEDFWSQKPRYTHWFYRLLSYLIAPLSVCIFNNANTIGVYRDSRIISTFKETIKKLQDGASVVIFPEHDQKYNNIIYDFQDRFIDVAKLYYKKTGKEVCFVPLYISPKLRKMYIGKPTRFNSSAPMDEERERIKKYLMEEISEIAYRLPRHTVVPYRNIPKKDYPLNIRLEEKQSEKACC